MGLVRKARRGVSQSVWRWRCKISPPKEGSDRTLEEIESFNSESSADLKKPAEAEKATPTTHLKVGYWYEGPNSFPPRERWDWRDYPPKAMSEPVAKALEEDAIAVYKVKDTDKVAVGNRYPLKAHHIYIHEHILLEALEPILKKYGTIVNVQHTLQLTEPFTSLYFAMVEIIALHKATPDASRLKGLLELLIKVLDDHFFKIKKEVRTLRAQKLISFEHAWTFFPAGTVLYTYGRNAEMLSEVVRHDEYPHKLEITVKMLTFDGNAFVWHERAVEIPRFSGNMPVTELPHYPLEFHEDAATLKRQLTDRGRKALDLQGLHYRTYDGMAQEERGPLEIPHNVEGRILIDVVGYNKYHLAQGKREGADPETVRNSATTRGGANSSGAKDSRGAKSSGAKNSRGAKSSDAQDVEGAEDSGAQDGSNPSLKRLSEEAQARNKGEMLEKEHLLMFIGPLIMGYALKNKKWLSFFIEDIRPMRWNDTAFDHLVYSEQQKDLVMTFVEHHGKNQEAFDDVIIGKGQGLIMLLSGPPGTGKTLTAEAVADRTHRPLLYIQAEDLGISADVLGTKIKNLFAMAIDWNAVVLLDEADVFMAERNPNDIHRNELVSIFLRELEYFRGIIFLTTNLYHTIDSAFKSRVNLHLLFQPLTADARRLVWQKFLGRLPAPPKDGKEEEEEEEGGEGVVEVDVGDEDMGELALWRMNGREIKNAVKMARLWCGHKGYTLTLERMENAIKSTSPHASKDGEQGSGLYD